MKGDLFEVPKLSPAEARYERKIKRWRKLRKLDYRQSREILSDRWGRTAPEMQSDLKEFLFLAGRALLLYHSLMRKLLEERISDKLRERLERVCGFDRLLMTMPDGVNTSRCEQRVAEMMIESFGKNRQSADPAALGLNVGN